jgi:outer membrane protein assembly factor BamB
VQNNPFQGDDDENRVEIVDLDTLDENTNKEDSVATPLSSRKVPHKKLDQRRVLLAIRIGLAALTLAGSLTLGVLIWPTIAPNFSIFNKVIPTATAGAVALKLDPASNITSQVYSSNGVAYIFATRNGAKTSSSGPRNLPNLSLEAVRQDNGTVLWSYRTWNSDAGQTPDQVVLAMGTLYISSLNNLVALRASDGDILWQKDTVGRAILVNNTVIYITMFKGPGIYALRASDGQVLWHNSTFTYALANDPINVTDQGLYVFENGSNDLLSLSLVDGTILWRYHIPAGNSMLTSTNREVNSFSNAAGSLIATGANSKITRWHFDNVLKIWTTYDARLYALLSSGQVIALDPLTGSILWQQSSIGDILQIDAGILYTTPLATNGIDGRNIDNGTMIWHDNVATFPIIAQDGVLYVSTPMALAAFNATNGQQRWQIAVVNVQILQIADGNIYLQLGDEGSVEVLKVLNAQKLWSYAGYDSTDNSLSEQYGITYVSSLSRGTVVARHSSNGSILWTYTVVLINNHSINLPKTF